MAESIAFRPTSDVCDDNDDAQIVTERFVSLGGVPHAAGPASTVKAHEDNSKVKEAVAEPGEGRVLVIDGGGSMAAERQRQNDGGGTTRGREKGIGWWGHRIQLSTVFNESKWKTSFLNQVIRGSASLSLPS